MPSKRKLSLAGGLAVSVVAAPFAAAAGEGGPLDGGVRNPSANQTQAYTSETEIIANSTTYGTRQSNKSGNGGGAIYGCRSGAGGTAANNEPCIRSNNLAAGRAFEFATKGAEGGRIDVSGGQNVRPFTTNANGVATGLNADRVDGLEGAQLRARVAQVGADGRAATTRGVVANGVTRQGVGDYNVVFEGDLTSCGITSAVIGTEGGQVSVVPAAAADRKTTVVDVRTFSATGTAADRGFHLAASC